MGQQLGQFFAEAEKISLNAKMRLVMLVNTTSGQAEDMPDTPEMVQKFRAALDRIKNEIKA